jgi:hypothetical protein
MNSDSNTAPIVDKSAPGRTNRDRNSARDDEDPPIYYDSEPSSQPPRYPNTNPSQTESSSFTKPPVSTNKISTPSPVNQHRNSAQASTVAAVLALPYEDLDAQRRADRKNKTLRQRWKDFKERNFGQEYDESRDGVGSSAEWNVQGGKFGGGMASPYRRKSTK